MAQVIASSPKSISIKRKLLDSFGTVATGIVASIIQVYLQFILKQCQILGLLPFSQFNTDWLIDLLPCILFWTFGLCCFYFFYRFSRPFYAILSSNVCAALFTISYGYSSDYWLSNWHFGFDHAHNIASDVFPYFITVARIYPVCLGIMFSLSLLIAKSLDRSQVAPSAEKRYFLKKDWVTLTCLIVLSVLVWIGKTGTLGIFPATGPSYWSSK